MALFPSLGGCNSASRFSAKDVLLVSVLFFFRRRCDPWRWIWCLLCTWSEVVAVDSRRASTTFDEYVLVCILSVSIHPGLLLHIKQPPPPARQNKHFGSRIGMACGVCGGWTCYWRCCRCEIWENSCQVCSTRQAIHVRDNVSVGIPNRGILRCALSKPQFVEIFIPAGATDMSGERYEPFVWYMCLSESAYASTETNWMILSVWFYKPILRWEKLCIGIKQCL